MGGGGDLNFFVNYFNFLNFDWVVKEQKITGIFMTFTLTIQYIKWDIRLTDIEINMLINGAYIITWFKKKDKVPYELIEDIYKAL